MEEVFRQDPAIDSDLKDYRDEIQKAYTDCIRELKKIHAKNMRLFYSLDSAYSENVKKVMKNQSVGLLGQEVAKKIAYLSTSFQVFSQATIPPAYHQGLYDKVEASLITAYQSQLGAHLPQNLLEDYILDLLKKEQCARIRGENSNCDHIRVWYDDRDSTFLICSKSYFDKLNSPVDLSKRDFENALVNAGILCTVQRKDQVRRTFEIVVQKGRGKVSVLKIKAGSLSDKFSENARKHLEQMKKDKTSYRS